MTSNSEISPHIWGISVRGPYHIERNEPNQDAWYGKTLYDNSLIVVCDGLGSRKQSAVGAQQACIAVKESVRIWQRSNGTNIVDLIHLIELIWKIRLPGKTTGDFATTCLFATVFPSKKYVIAGLGDGIATVSHADGSVTHVLGRQNDFGNYTHALGCAHGMHNWQIYSGAKLASGSRIFLATDGISEDLKSQCIADFIEWLIEQYGALSPQKRYWRLRHALTNWPTPKHQDDKTLAILYCD